MQIYTSYFGKLDRLPKNIVPISICGKAPDWYTGLQFKKLAPKYEFFKQWEQTHNNEFYIKCYNEQVLQPLNVNEIVKELTELGQGNDIALICYEKPTDFCHRHLVATWLRNNGYSINEYIELD